MKLTENEQKICDKYSEYKNGKVKCCKCPLVIDQRYLLCYANIDGKTREAKELKRL